MRFELLAPGNVLCLLTLLPLAVVFVRGRRRRHRAALALGLQSEPWRATAAAFAASAGAVSLLVLAASRPVAWLDDRLVERTDAEAYVVVDTSASMLARRAPASPSRIAHARRALAGIVNRMQPELPLGLAVMPQSLLPILSPTVDRSALLDVGGRLLFAGTLPTKAIAPTAPAAAAAYVTAAGVRPPSSNVATNFTALGTLALAPFYTRTSAKRLAIVITDGESDPFISAGVGELLSRAHIQLLVLRVGTPHDRLWRRVRGRLRLDTGYRPTLAGVAPLASLSSSLGGRGLYREADLPQLVERARRLVGEGPTRRVGARREPVALGRYVALASLPLLAVAVAPLLPPAPAPLRRRRTL